MDQQVYTCPDCGILKFQFIQFAKHLKSLHEHDPAFSVSCHFESCKSVFKKVDSFVKHVHRRHKNFVRNNSKVVGAVTDTVHTSSVSSDDEHSVGHREDRAIRCNTMSGLLLHMNASFAKFILSVREQHLLPAAVQEQITSGMQAVVKDAVVGFADVVKSQLEQKDIIDDSVNEVLNVDMQLDDFGSKFQSEYRLLRYLKESNKIVMPQTFVVDANDMRCTFQYVSILEQLKQLLSVDEVFCHIAGKQREQDSPSSILRDYCDGDLFVADKFFQDNPTAFQIHMYADEFEPCNAIGPDRGKHKVTAFYYTVGNLHQKYRSQLRFIFLALLVDYKFLKSNNHDYCVFLKPLINDLQTLQETGIEVNVAGSLQVFRGKLVTVSADNLTAHDLAGFQRHFNCGRICRSCFIDYSDIATAVVEDDVHLRTAEMCAYHLDGVQVNPKNAMVYGMLKKCVFNDLSNFDVCAMFPHDIMHDLLEGVVPLTVRLVLCHFVTGEAHGHISVADINVAIDQCEMTDVSNRPNHMTMTSLTSNLSGSATHKLNLFLMLPRIVGRYIDLSCESDVWNVYLLLREVCDIVLSPVIDRDQLTHLQELTACFLQMFVATFGSDRVIPKMHYMIHYPGQIAKFGPLRNLWCMRFEGKHQYFKKLAVVMKSHKNTCYSLAKRHQMRVSWELMSDTAIFDNDVACCSKTYCFSVLPLDLQCAITNVLDRSVDGNDLIASVNRRAFNGVTIACKKCYALEPVQEEEVPVFCVVKYIVCVHDSWLLCCRLVLPDHFEQWYHAYCVTELDDWCVVRPQQLADHSPVDYFKLRGLTYVSLRYHIVRT